MKKYRKNIIISIIMVLISIIYTIIVKKIDVQNIGPNNSSVGLAKINGYFTELIGSNMLIYKITEILGIFAILVAMLFAIKGLLQLIKRKSILKINKEILALGCLYIIVIILYIFFEKVIINYRPILIDNELEASYPSSHTMLAICICLSAIKVNKYLFKNQKFISYFNAYLIFLAISITVGRLLSGVHWLTDIIGGILISLSLIKIFNTYIDCIQNKKSSGN